MMYEGDSFFTLSQFEQVGLVCIAASLAAVCIYGVWRFSRNRPWYVRLLWALAIFWWFEFLSPQVFYFYYVLIFENLPLRLVLNWPPGAAPSELLQLLLFQLRDNLSFHGRALLGWLLIALALLRPKLAAR